MDSKELLEVYKTLFETWRFQVNSHWQRSSFFSAFETVALAASWKLFTDKTDAGAAFLGALLACLGLVLTLVWFLMSDRTHQYARYWLKSVGEVEAKLMERSNESGVDFARKIFDDRRSTITKSIFAHHALERAVPSLFVIAWITLLLFGIGHLPGRGCVMMHRLLSYESIALAIAVASLLVSAAAVWIARSALFHAKQIADRDRKDWVQRKWFDLYFKADEAYDALDRFQALYPSPSSPDWNTEKMQAESHDLMRTMRTVHRIALVFPQNPVIHALFNATAAFKNMEEATSKDRLSKVLEAVEDIRQKSLLDVSVLD
jgi:hypothetical protein